ncbi:MAG: ribosomal protein S18-alanine N-acetyltransferase [Jatrophihabitans sp.]|uniref:ribosomal protein S18-alanine N-acetyltransferase n=1 Tax=Jatrophihabitans sp. TaxID=1932789 RepID=UPI003F7FFD65
MTARIVPMTRAHIDALMPYEHEMFGTEAWSYASYRDELADKRFRAYYAAEDTTDGRDGDLLGWAGVMVVGDTAQVLTVGVVPAARRRGIGQQLLDTLLDEARRRGAEQTVLEVRVDNEPALALYRRNGFADLRVRRGYYANGRVDALEMQRAL